MRHLFGAPNFRDIGGAPTEDGRQVRAGRLYRSERLAFLTDPDLEALRVLDIRLVCDLRSEAERRRHPNRWPAGASPECMHPNILVDLGAGNASLMEMLRADHSAEGARRLMREIYRRLPAAIAPGLGQLIRRLAAGEFPALVHCAAGKDRTGFVCASILRVLGVGRDHIYSDYLRSADAIDKLAYASDSREQLEQLLGSPLPPAVIDAVYGVATEYLDAAFSQIQQEFGSFAAYIERGAGLTPATLERLRAQLLTR